MVRRYSLSAILSIQSILLLIGFNKFFVRPFDFMFKNEYDGLKNYFTLESYLRQDIDINWWQFEGMNYPFGEYTFYTDNTPAFAFLLKILVYLGLDVAPYSVLIINAFCLISILISSYLCYKILVCLLKTDWIIILLSITLPWINPQILRLDVGHFNLSWSWVILWTIYLLLQLYQHFQNHQNLSRRHLLTLGGLLFLSGWIHLYYLIMLTILVGSFGVFWTISRYKHKAELFKILKYIPLVIIPVLMVYGIIRWIDIEYAARLSPGGYNWSAWTLKPGTLYTPYNLFTLPFLIHSDTDFYYEDLCYLGSFSLYGGLFISLILGLKYFKIIDFKFTFPKNEWSFLLLLGLSSLVLLFISMGDYVVLDDGTKIYNFFSLFFYANLIDDSLMQFRCLARFGWVFFWAVAFIVAFGLDQLWQMNSISHDDTTIQQTYSLKIAIIILGVFNLIDATDLIKHYNHITPRNNLTYTQNFQGIVNLSAQIDATKYQAILPLPYFNTGSENMDYTIDATSELFIPTLQFSRLTNLPLLSSQLSRTPDYQTKELFTLFNKGDFSPIFYKFFDGKPILILYHKKLLQANPIWNPKEAEPAKSVIRGSDVFLNQNKEKINLIVETTDYQLYEWNGGW